MGTEAVDRFWSRVDKGAACWEWTGATTSGGYGAAWWAGRSDKAHRVAWRLATGEIPVGARVSQSCGNRRCCRPEHLELRAPGGDDPVGRADEVRRRKRKTVSARGHLESRGAGQWRLTVYRGRDPETGKRRYERRSFRGMEAEAQVALARLVVELAEGGLELEARDLTFGEVLDLWYRHVVSDLELTTAETYRHELAYVPERLRRLPVRRVTTEHLEEFYRQLRESGRKRDGKGLAQTSVRSVHQRVDAALRFAKRRRWILVNPAGDVEWTNPRKSERRRPTPAPLADVRTLLDRAEHEEGLALAVYLRVSAAAGGRRGEVHGLRWSGVEWAESRVRLVDNIVRAGRRGWIVKSLPKDDQPRLVALGQATMDLLARRRIEAEALCLACGVALPAKAFVFTNEPDGSRPWIPDTTWQRYRRLCRSLGMDPTRLHDLRAMMSTQLIEHGIPIPVVSARLGHAQNSTTAMTLDVYTGRNPDLDRQAADLMDRLLDGEAGTIMRDAGEKDS